MKALPLIIGGVLVAGAGTGLYFYLKNKNAAAASASNAGGGSGGSSGNSGNSIANKVTNYLDTGSNVVNKVQSLISSISVQGGRNNIDPQVYNKVAAMYPTKVSSGNEFMQYLNQSSSGKANWPNAFVRDVTEQYWNTMKKYGAEPKPKSGIDQIMNNQVLPDFFAWLTNKYGPGLSGLSGIPSRISGLNGHSLLYV